RDIPSHPMKVLEGCSDAALRDVATAIDEAIEAAAPLFNSGRAQATYHLFDGSSRQMERALPTACAGPTKVLADARKRAESMADPAQRAWAMRDAFEGLREVVSRKLVKAPKP